jgi:hypothetical protein
MRRGSVGRVREILTRDYPDADVQVRRDFGGGMRASVLNGANELHFSIADDTGVLASVLGLGPDDAGPGDGGQGARLSA